MHQPTPQQSQYLAWQLTRRAASDSIESLAATLVDAQVDLNPHQVDAALFACRNPLSRGVILADEVGLAKPSKPGWSSRSAGQSGGTKSSSSSPPTCANSGTKNCRTNSA